MKSKNPATELRFIPREFRQLAVLTGFAGEQRFRGSRRFVRPNYTLDGAFGLFNIIYMRNLR
jgi:hypothetical protein